MASVRLGRWVIFDVRRRENRQKGDLVMLWLGLVLLVLGIMAGLGTMLGMGLERNDPQLDFRLNLWLVAASLVLGLGLTIWSLMS